MSDQTFIIVAVVGTFVAVVVGAISVSVARQGRRVTGVLQAHLQSAGVDLTRAPSEGPVSQRLVLPVIQKLSSFIGRLTPVGLRNAIARKLTLAGNSRVWTAEVVLVLQLATIVGGAFAGYRVGMSGDPRFLGPLWIPLLAFAGYLLPVGILDRRAVARQEDIRRHLADMIDLLTISVEAGLAFDAALLHVRRSMKGPLSEEIGRMLHEMQLGVGRIDAMRHLSERSDVEELRGFVLAMVQADIFGVSVANVLRAQSDELRTKRRQRAEEKAMKTPVKLLFPMIACILPALLILIVGPGAIRIVHTFGNSGGAGVFGP